MTEPLATAPRLIMDQVTSWLTNDFAILDEGGETLGSITTQGGLGSRVLLGSRQLTVLDVSGAPYVHLDDVVNFGLDTYELYDADSAPVATITKEFTFFTKRLTIEMATGDQLQLAGDWWDWDFAISAGELPIARVARDFPGIAQAFLGRSKYVIEFESIVSPDHRRATIGATLAIDLIRAKARRSSAAT
jgi:uncharacterized protein YxjI